MTLSLRRGIAALALVVSVSPALYAQPPTSAGGSGDSAELAKKLSNPISDLVSVPFQFNWEQNVGPKDQTRFVLAFGVSDVLTSFFFSPKAGGVIWGVGPML